MNFKQLDKILTSNGWQVDRSKGSHFIYTHPVKKTKVVVPFHGKKDLGTGLVNSILKQAGLK